MDAENFLKKVYYDPRHPRRLWGCGGCLPCGRKRRCQRQSETNQGVTYTLHRPVRRRFKRNRVVVLGIDEQWQADLVDVSSLALHNGGPKCLLTCIDVFSKFAWAVPLKDKKGSSLVAALELILKSGRTPHRLQTDKGTEFTNRLVQSFLKKHDIYFFTTFNETKASVVERFNRTLKTKMWKYFTSKNTYDYRAVLPDLLKAYNAAFHRSIKRAPSSVTIPRPLDAHCMAPTSYPLLRLSNLRWGTTCASV